MRYITLFILLAFSQKLCAQEIELTGRYSAGFLGAETIDFVGKDSFYFSGFYCTNGVQGKGTCDIRDNKLFLYFEKAKSTTAKSLNRYTLTPLSPASAPGKISIEVLDSLNNYFPFISVAIQKNLNRQTYYMTDTGGRVKFTFIKEDLPVKIHITGVGYKEVQISIDSFYNYAAKVIYRDPFFPDKDLNNGEVYVYEIDDASENLILMRPIRSTEPFRKYRKVNPDSTALSNH